MFGWIKKAKVASKLQDELKIAFSKRGMNFMQLHPVIHNVVLREAINYNSAEMVAEKFFVVAETIAKNDEMKDDEERAKILLEYHVELSKVIS